MRFGFDLVSSDASLGNMDLLDTHLDFFGRNIPSKAFVPLQYILKKSSRHVFQMSSRHVFNASSGHLHLCKTSCEMSSRRLQDVLEDEKLLRRRRFEVALMTNKCLLG